MSTPTAIRSPRGATVDQFSGSRASDPKEDIMTNQPTMRDGAEREISPALARRGFFRSAAGGLLVAAGGLWLPGQDEEAQARDGAFGGKLGGRRGKNRRGKERRDRKPDRDRKPPAPPRSPGAADPLMIAVDFTNLRDTPVTLDVWEAAFQDWDNWFQTNASWKQVPVPVKPATGQPPVKTYIGNQVNMAVAIAPDRVLYIETDSPSAAANVAVLTGTWSASGRNPITGVLAVKMDMPIGFVLESNGVRVKRLANRTNLIGEDSRAAYEVSSI
jgi:hypothetical protein